MNLIVMKTLERVSKNYYYIIRGNKIKMDIAQFIEDSINKDLYIYGAGLSAFNLVKYMFNEGIYTALKGILVSETNGNETEIMGIPVIKYDECKIEKNSRVIVSVLSGQKDIKINLEKSTKNIYLLKKDEYLEIRSLTANYEFEIFRYIRNLESMIIDIDKRNQCIRKQNDYNGYDFDKKLYLDDFLNLKKNQVSYQKKLTALLKNLDSKSVAEVYRILGRLNLLVQGEEILYSKDERKILESIESDFYGNIYDIGLDYYVYKEYFLPNKNFEQPVFWYRHGLDSVSNLENIKSKAIIDAGAYIGDSALILSEYTKDIVYSFEADKTNCGKIEYTKELNKRYNIVAINKALSDKSERIRLYSSDFLDTSNSIKDTGKLIDKGDYCYVEAISLDEFVDENKLSVGLIKTDVEGAEQKLLMGARKTICEQKPILIISIYHSLDDFFNIKAYIEDLDLGYKFKIFRPCIKGSFLAETVLICEV